MSEASDTLEAQIQLGTLAAQKQELLEYRETNSAESVRKSRNEHEKNKKSLKSDLKKTTAFVKKIKNITAEGLAQCIRETETLNLNMYIAEIVTALLETAYKATDIAAVVKLCECLHRRYNEFTDPLIAGLRSSLLALPSNEEDKDGPKKRRIQSRLMVELFQAGVFTDDAFFVSVIKMLLGKRKAIGSALSSSSSSSSSSEGAAGGGVAINKKYADLQGLSAFAKYGAECLLGYCPPKLQQLSVAAGQPIDAATLTPADMQKGDCPIRLLASVAVCEAIREQLAPAFTMLCGDLTKAHKDVRSKERRYEKDSLLHGSLSEDKQLDLENAKKFFEKLLSVVQGLSECMNEGMPALEEDEEEEEKKGGLTVVEKVDAEYGPYSDLESQQFYDQLPDLLATVPLAAFGMTEDQAKACREKWKADREARLGGDAAAAAGDGDGGEKEGEDEEGLPDIAEQQEESVSALQDGGAAGEGEEQITSFAKLAILLEERLPECITKQRIDAFCESFCYLQPTKGHRKKLVTALLYVPRSRMELIAPYSRIIATLNRIFPDIAPPILDQLRRSFYGALKHKRQDYMDDKARTIRYVAELCKFGVAPPMYVFRTFKDLLGEFTHHNIDLTARLMEDCGRYLYLLPHSHSRMVTVMDTTLRLKRQRNVDMRQAALLESAYFAIKPPEKEAKKVITYTLVQRYARHLILQKLGSQDCTVDQVARALRRLPWDGPPPATASNATETVAPPSPPAPASAIVAVDLDAKEADDQQQEGREEAKEEEEEEEKEKGPQDEEVQKHVIAAMMRLVETKYVNIAALAELLATLRRSLPDLPVTFVDTLAELLQHGLEVPYRREPQKLIGIMRMLGELYNHECVSSSLVYDTMYLIINHGHEGVYVPPTAAEQAAATAAAAAGAGESTTSDNSASMMPSSPRYVFDKPTNRIVCLQQFDPRLASDKDPTHDTFRAQLVCELLKTCGSHFVNAGGRARLGRYLTYFQRWLLTKPALPVHVEYLILDTLDMLEEGAFRVDVQAWERKNGASAAATTTGVGGKQHQKKLSKKALALQQEGKKMFERKGPIFPRYDTLASTIEAVGLIEAKEAAQEAARALSGTVVEDQAESEDEDESGESDSDDEEGEEEEEGGAALSGEEEEEDDDDEDDEDDDDESDSDGSEDSEYELTEEEALKRMREMRSTKEQEKEDEEFDELYREMMNESLSASRASSKAGAAASVNRMAVPAVLPRPKNLPAGMSLEQFEAEQNSVTIAAVSAASPAPAPAPAHAPSPAPAPAPTRTATALRDWADSDSDDYEDEEEDTFDVPGESSLAEAEAEAEAAASVAVDDVPPGEKKVFFKLLTRDTKGKVESRVFGVSEQAPMVVKLAQAQGAKQAEKDELKRRTLALQEASEVPPRGGYSLNLTSSSRGGTGLVGHGGADGRGGGSAGGTGSGDGGLDEYLDSVRDDGIKTLQNQQYLPNDGGKKQQQHQQGGGRGGAGRGGAGRGGRGGGTAPAPAPAPVARDIGSW